MQVEPQHLEFSKSCKGLAWKHKTLATRVKTFNWRLLRRALATGGRASRFLPHIDKHCTRCGKLENVSHIFFSIVILQEQHGLQQLLPYAQISYQ